MVVAACIDIQPTQIYGWHCEPREVDEETAALFLPAGVGPVADVVLRRIGAIYAIEAALEHHCIADRNRQAR